jgi:long-chain acyl-CoA synthetase
MPKKTIVQTFMENAHSYPADTIIKYKPEKGGHYTDCTWSELSKAVTSFACALTNLGLQAGERVAILSFNRLEWIIADLGIMMAGGVVVPIYHTSTAEQTAYIAKDSGAAFVVVEDAEQSAKIRSQIEELPDLRRIVFMDGGPSEDDSNVLKFSELLKEGAAGTQELLDEIASRTNAVNVSDLATIVYTSGTTGPPKGCMISHDNIASVLNSIHQLIQVEPRDNLSLMILPISHLYPRVSGYYYNIFMNIPLAIAESLDTLGQNMTEVHPTYFTSVPRIFEKVYDRIVSAAEQESGFKRTIFRWAVGVGRERSRAVNSGMPLSLGLRAQFALADKLVFGKIRNMLGGRLWFAVSAGAPLSAEVGEFIHSIGIQVLEFYALTETITGTMTTFEQCRYGTVGKPMPGCDVEIAPDGEILIRGNNFMGYYNRPDLTSEVVRDGWCYTGDVGKWDEDGFLLITDRKKDLIITSGGKNISPQNIENLLKRLPLVSMAMVYGDNKKYLTALLTLDEPETQAWAEAQGVSLDSYEEITRSGPIRGFIQEGIDRINGSLARYETIKKFIILPRDLSQEESEITPTLKLKRKAVRTKYGHLLEALYSDEQPR